MIGFSSLLYFGWQFMLFELHSELFRIWAWPPVENGHFWVYSPYIPILQPNLLHWYEFWPQKRPLIIPSLSLQACAVDSVWKTFWGQNGVIHISRYANFTFQRILSKGCPEKNMTWKIQRNSSSWKDFWKRGKQGKKKEKLQWSPMGFWNNLFLQLLWKHLLQNSVGQVSHSEDPQDKDWEGRVSQPHELWE